MESEYGEEYWKSSYMRVSRESDIFRAQRDELRSMLEEQAQDLDAAEDPMKFVRLRELLVELELLLENGTTSNATRMYGADGTLPLTAWERMHRLLVEGIELVRNPSNGKLVPALGVR